MQVNVKGESRYISVSTVTLYKEDGVTYPFHCVVCGNTSNIIGGRVTNISPILEPSDQIPVISTCKSCKAKYVFQDSQEETDTIYVLLFPKPIIQSFYCYLGGGETKFGNKILEYDTNQVYSYLKDGMVPLPFTTRCTNIECPLTYKFSQLN